MIHIVQTKDYILLAELNKEIQSLHHNLYPKIFKPYNKESSINFFRNTLNAENAVAFVANDNEGGTLGYVLLFMVRLEDNHFQFSRTFVLLDQILVLRKYQGRGVGKQLIETAIDFARANNIDTVELNHWTLNDVAGKFFTRNKFDYYNGKMWRLIQ